MQVIAGASMLDKPERIKELREGGPGIDLETATYIRDALDNPRFQRAAQALREYNDALLNYAIQAGAITPDQVSNLQIRYPNYIPLRRVLADVEADLAGRTGGGTGGDPLKTLSGSGRRVRTRRRVGRSRSGGRT